MKHVIEAEKLVKKFGKFTAVDQLDINLLPGETLGLLGPNGAGKTTTIGMMIGLLKPTEGKIEVLGESDPTQISVRKQIGVAPQALSIYDELTAEENLSFFGKLYKLSGAHLKSRVEWALEFSRLQDRRKSRVGTFSGGMKRRLNFACALVHEPKIVLLDEPTVGVDPQSRNHIFEGVEQLQQQGLSIIYTTHYMEEAERLCNRVAIIDHGKLLELDSVENLIGRHGGESLVTGELQAVPDKVSLPGKSVEHSWTTSIVT